MHSLSFCKRCNTRYCWRKVDIIDGSSGTVRELKRRLEENNMESESKKKGNLDIFNSLEDNKILELSKKLIEIK